VRQWRRWEEEAPDSAEFLRISTNNGAVTPRFSHGGDGRVLQRARKSAKTLWARVGSTQFAHGVRVAFAVVTSDLIFSPINRAVYYSLRLMFIDQLHLDHSFDFASFVER
jgi:hypothetical protein